MTKIKICGITNLEDALLATKLKANILGFVFAKSPRKVTEVRASEIIKKLPKSILKCAVFVNEKKTKVEKIQKKLKFDFLQFHGNESIEYCSSFGSKAKIIKAFRLKDKKSIKDVLSYNVDLILLDSYVRNLYGGTGKLLNLKLAKDIKEFLNKKLVISGGLNSKNVIRAIKLLQPYIVDVSSSIEKSPGKKDPKLLREFIKKVKSIRR